MDSRINIQNELQQISPEVAGISAGTPYAVPAGYFENLATYLLQLVRQEQEVSAVLTPQAGNNPYTVPQGYFDILPDLLLQRVQQIEPVFAVLTEQARNNPYQVPNSYFNTLPDLLLNKAKAGNAANATEELQALSPLLGSIGKKMPFSMPADYFTELPGNASAGAQAIDFVNEELENLSPLMSSLQQKQAYQVPAGYFEQLPQQVLDKVTQPSAKVVSISFTRKLLRYTAAAAIAVVIITAGRLYMNKPARQTDNPYPVQVAMHDAVKQAVSDSLHSFEDQDLQNYLEAQGGASPENTAIAGNEIKAADVQDMLGDVSDAELQQYLEQYTALNTNNNNTYTN